MWSNRIELVTDGVDITINPKVDDAINSTQ